MSESKSEIINDFEDKLVHELEQRGGDRCISIIENGKNNNTKCRAIAIREKSRNISPTIYLSQYQADYENGKSIETIAAEIERINLECQPTKDFDVSRILDFEQVKDKICFKVVNAAMNETALALMPHRIICDLAICYYILIEDCNDKTTTASISIKNNLMDAWNVEEGDLYILAENNTLEHLKCIIEPIEKALSLLNDPNESYRRCELTNAEILYSPESFMYIASNTKRTNGAVVIVYRELLSKFAELIDDDVIIIPSSIHEALLIPSNLANDIEMLKAIVSEVNSTQVALSDQLSDNVYIYNRESQEILIMN